MICRELQRYFQNWEANWGLRSEMMESGKPCKQKMFMTVTPDICDHGLGNMYNLTENMANVTGE
jgi:hypothetical protein